MITTFNGTIEYDSEQEKIYINGQSTTEEETIDIDREIIKEELPWMKRKIWGKATEWLQEWLA